MPEKRTGKKITFRGKTKVCEFYKGKPWNKAITQNMKKFEDETNQKAVYRGVVTGSYEYWKYWKGEFTVRKRRTKTEVKTTKKKEKITVEETYTKYSTTQLEAIAIKHRNKMPAIGRRQIVRYIVRLNDPETSGNWVQVYRLKIIEIFDMYNVPYDKKMIVKRKVLIDA